MLSDANRALVERALGVPLLYMDLSRDELNALLDAARAESQSGLLEALKRIANEYRVNHTSRWARDMARNAVARAEGLPSRLENEFGQTNVEKSSADPQAVQPMRSVSGEGGDH